MKEVRYEVVKERKDGCKVVAINKIENFGFGPELITYGKSYLVWDDGDVTTMIKTTDGHLSYMKFKKK